jgi:hypothetical protein
MLERLRARLRDLALANSGKIADELRTHFVIEGDDLANGLATIEVAYPGVAQPGDTASGVVAGRRELWGARRDGKTRVRWVSLRAPWSDADELELRAATPHVLTIAARALPPGR